MKKDPKKAKNLTRCYNIIFYSIYEKGRVPYSVHHPKINNEWRGGQILVILISKPNIFSLSLLEFSVPRQGYSILAERKCAHLAMRPHCVISLSGMSKY
jgi:hypothetical protein